MTIAQCSRGPCPDGPPLLSRPGPGFGEMKRKVSQEAGHSRPILIAPFRPESLAGISRHDSDPKGTAHQLRRHGVAEEDSCCNNNAPPPVALQNKLRRHGVAGEISRGWSEARTEPPDCCHHEDGAPEVREKRRRAARAIMSNGWREDFSRTSGAQESFHRMVRGFRSFLAPPPANLFRHSVAEEDSCCDNNAPPVALQNPHKARGSRRLPFFCVFPGLPRTVRDHHWLLSFPGGDGYRGTSWHQKGSATKGGSH